MKTYNTSLIKAYVGSNTQIKQDKDGLYYYFYNIHDGKTWYSVKDYLNMNASEPIKILKGDRMEIKAKFIPQIRTNHVLEIRNTQHHMSKIIKHKISNNFKISLPYKD